MRKGMVLLAAIFLVLSATSVFAGGKSGDTGSCEGKPLSKPADKNIFNAASWHISTWGKSMSNAREDSLRGDKKAVAARRGCAK